ncbi:MAG: 23S rRNA (adenine(2503)-C(2))-methyltransferase RlmN [Vampirovibrionales bacterium]
MMLTSPSITSPVSSTIPLSVPPTESTGRFEEVVLEASQRHTPTLIGLSLPALEALAESMGEPKFRAKQLHHWLYVKCVRNLEDMSDLSKAFRTKLAERFEHIGPLVLHTKQVSKDGTIKYLFKLHDGQVVESVLMPYQERGTFSVCISSQVGCAVGCEFCATGKLGFKRNLTAAEILDQYLFVQRDCGEEVRNIVFMGQGEPLLNLEHLLPAIHILNHSAEVGMRRMTISTSGIVPGIYELANSGIPVTLAISLHGPTNAVREAIMPINKRWPLEQLMPALKTYHESNKRRLTIEYILLEGVNDEHKHAIALAQLLKPLMCHINLIPYNPISSSLPNVKAFKRPSRERIEDFAETVFKLSNKKVTIRLERGVDIDAACGQLANRLREAETL